jgi:drug/metabolite transporter (DMT)-like permease
MISKLLASPSGRSSSRRLAFIVTVFGGVLVGVWQGLTGGDVASGVLALFAALLGATGSAVTIGRFAEKGTEAMPEGSEDEIESRRRR